HRGEAERPPARNQEKPGADRPIEPREPEIGPGDSGGVAVDPVSGRIGDASGAVAHLPSGEPVSVSKVPPPLLMLLALGTGAVSASLSEGPAGRGGASAILHSLARISAACAVPVLIWSITCGGIPHQVALAVANLSILACAGRLLASWISLALFSVSFRNLTKSVMHGGSWPGAGGNCA